MKQASVIGLVILGLAACDGGPDTPQDRMRDRYAPTQAVTVGGFSWEVSMAVRPDVVYAAGTNRLVQIDRATGDVVELFSDYQQSQIAQIAADDTHVYAVLQHGGGPAEVVRIARGGGAPESVLAPASRSFDAIAVQGGALYALYSEGGQRRIVEISAPGAEPRVLTDEAGGSALTGIAAATDGIFFGLVSSAGEVWRVPYAGGAPENVQTWADKYAFHLAADATGVYWNAGDIAMGATGPATLYFLPNGATQPEVLATDVTRGEFSVNDLGFYWVDYEARSIRAVAREDVGGGDFDLIGTGDAPMGLVADDRAIVYSTNDDDDDLGDLELHVVPRTE